MLFSLWTNTVVIFGFVAFKGCYADLYVKVDDVSILNNTNFYEELLNKDNAWVIQFYNTWCGHCQHFAPLYKKVSSDIKNWAQTIKSGVVDCADDENAEICREYKVNSYPSIQVFGAFAKKGDLGVQMPPMLAKTFNVDNIEGFLIDTLSNYQIAGNSSKMWSDLQYSNGSVNQARNMQGNKALIIIYEPKESIVGRQVMLDLQHLKQVLVKRFKVTIGGKFRSLFISKDGLQDDLEITEELRKNLYEQIIKKLKLPVSMQPLEKVTEDSIGKIDTSHFIPPTNNPKNQTVYLVDVENTLLRILNHEFTLHEIIENESFLALRDFVEVLSLCLPAREPIHNFLKEFHRYLSDKYLIKGEELTSIYNSISTNTAFLPEEQSWIGCLGSMPKFRGFPCGLWTTFHVLTVANCSLDSRNRVERPLRVLDGIHGFVKYFFSCRECSEHFQAMYKKDAYSYVFNKDEAISWLWKAHNKVNDRLQNSISEDPHYKKVPFPPPQLCSECWSGDNFVETESIQYLKNIYKFSALSMKGVTNITVMAQKYNDNTHGTMLNVVYIILAFLITASMFLFLVKVIKHRRNRGRDHVL